MNTTEEHKKHQQEEDSAAKKKQQKLEVEKGKETAVREQKQNLFKIVRGESKFRVHLHTRTAITFPKGLKN